MQLLHNSEHSAKKLETAFDHWRFFSFLLKKPIFSDFTDKRSSLHNKYKSIIAIIFMFGLFNSPVIYAADDDFVEVKVALQISDYNPKKQTLVLNVANNLIKHYGQDTVKVEVVAFGPGLRLLQKGNTNTDRIQSLVDSGVRFSACSNTIKNFSKKLGHSLALNSNAITVSAGVVRIIDLSKKGYQLIKP